ncbi:MAG TPA: VanZ family protein [Methylomirabilota bacterium]|jgi:glycopeptide antibiotics resistance protein|nr:VanZ family protein [Methylomirabilota bacterium]
MKKFLILFAIIAFLTFSGHKSYAQSEDLCGGTGGTGRIVSLGNNTFTLQRNDGRNLIVNLIDQATIETAAGSATFSDLKIGDRVTLVGGPNPDRSFTAENIVVCAAATTENPIIRKENTNFNQVNFTINLLTLLLFVLIWLAMVVFFRVKKRKSFMYLLFFTIFYIYLYKVLDYTLIQFQSLLLLQHFVPDLMLRGVEAGRSLNLIPLVTLTLKDVKTSLLNILMMMPFGFGLPFISNFRMKQTVIAGLSLSIIIELLQLITGFISNTTFRVADVNDLIFNTIGVLIGYILFIGFSHIYPRFRLFIYE